MYNLRAPFSFLVVVFYLFSTFLTIPASAETMPKQLWSIEYEGEPLFEPLLHQNEDLVVGKYSIIDGVYHNDFMAIDNTNGKVLDEWQATGASGAFSDEEGNVYIHSYDSQTSTLTLYTHNGEVLWEKKLGAEEDYFHVSSENNQLKVFDYVNEEVITYSIDGKELSRKAYNYEETDDIYYISDIDGNHLSLIKESPNGDVLLNKRLTVSPPENQVIDYGNVRVSNNGTLFVLLSLSDAGSYETVGHKLLVLDEQGNETASTYLPFNGWYEDVLVNENLHLMIDGTYIAIDETGTILNQTKLFHDGDHYVYDQRLMDDGRLYLLFEDTAVLVNRDGKVIWKKALPETDNEYSYWNMYDILENMYLYSQSNISSYEKLTGDQQWQYELTDDGSLAALLIDEPNGKAYYQTRKAEPINNGNEYDDYKMTTVVGAFSFKDQQPTNTVPPNKTWTITFNGEIDKSSVNDGSIYVVDSTGSKVSGINFEVVGQKVKILAPEEGYKANGTYRLVITKNVKSLSQTSLKAVVEKEFTIE